jgi:hypothetical protein
MSGRAGLLRTVITLLAITVGPTPHAEDEPDDNIVRGRFPEPPEPEPQPPPTCDIFLSYCRRDIEFAKRISDTFLKRLKDSGVLVYDEATIEPGAVIKEEEESALLDSVVAVLLISQDYFASDAINDELPKLLERASKGSTHVLRLDVGPWDQSEMESLTRYRQVGAGKPPLARMHRWVDRDDVFLELVGAIRRRLKESGRYPKTVQ